MNSRIRPSAALTSCEHRLQALLELAAVLGAGDQRAHVEREDRLVLQPLGHVAAHDALGEPLDDRRLADAGVADQHRVVLGLAREDLDHAPDLARRGRSRGRAGRCAPPRRGRGRTSRAPRRRPPGVALVTRWLPRTSVSASRKRSRRDAVLLEQPAGRGLRARVDHRQHARARRRRTRPSAARPPARRASSDLRERARVTMRPAGRRPGPLTRGRRSSCCSTARAQRVDVDLRTLEQARRRGRRAVRAARAAGARRRPRCGRSAAPWSARRAAPPGSSGSACCGSMRSPLRSSWLVAAQPPATSIRSSSSQASTAPA